MFAPRRTPAPRSVEWDRVTAEPEPGQLAVTEPGPFWAVITGRAAGTTRYSWVEIDEGDYPTFGPELAASFGAVGTTDEFGGPAYEISQRIDVPTGAKVKLWPAGDRTYYLFSYTGAGSTVPPDETEEGAIPLLSQDGTTTPTTLLYTTYPEHDLPATQLNLFTAENVSTTAPVHQFAIAYDADGNVVLRQAVWAGTDDRRGVTALYTLDPVTLTLRRALTTYDLDGRTLNYTVRPDPTTGLPQFVWGDSNGNSTSTTFSAAGSSFTQSAIVPGAAAPVTVTYALVAGVTRAIFTGVFDFTAATVLGISGGSFDPTANISFTGNNSFAGTSTFTNAATFTSTATFANTGLRIEDTNASHTLTLAPGTDLTANRTFTLTTGDANRTLDISAADVTISAFIATLLNDADAATARATLGVSGGSLEWVKVTKTYADLADSATENDIEIYSLPAGGVVHACRFRQSGAFGGGGISNYSLSVGNPVSGSEYYASSEGVTGAPLDRPFGSDNSFIYFDDVNTVISIRLYAVADIDLNNATGGSVDVWLLVSEPDSATP